MAFKEAFVDLFSNDSNSNQKTTRSTTTESSVKERILKTWNNIKYDLTSGTSLDSNSSLWLLGNHYYPSKESSLADDQCHIDEFITDFTSKAWFTYRSNFPSIQDTTLTTDTGWGCMIRSGQMMLAQALFHHLMGNVYNWVGKRQIFDRRRHEKILRWFLDSPDCPFSIHQLAKIGINYGNTPGDWYGPNTMAYMLQDAVLTASQQIPDLCNLKVTVAQDSTVYVDDVKELCNWPTTNHKTALESSLIILIPVRLGKTVLNSIYIPSLCSLFTLDNCIGIIGGKPNHSVYFVGFQDDYLFYLEPHYCQKADTPNVPKLLLRNYHTHIPRKMNIKKMDPSCCLGFYCKNFNEFQKLRNILTKITSPPKLLAHYPFCTFSDGKAEDHYYYSSNENSVKSKDKSEPPFEANSSAASQSTSSNVSNTSNSIAPKVNSKPTKNGKFSKFIDGIRTSSSNKQLKRRPSDNEFEIL